MKNIYIITTLLFLLNKTFGQHHDYNFINYTTKNGLNSNTTLAILKDKYGFMWFGTEDGLNRFDGKNFEIYNSDDTPGIGNSFIKCVTKSKNGNLSFRSPWHHLIDNYWN